ncbi:MAG: FAD-dependent thymidylate synthase, partial [Paraclostridium sp.]
VENTFDEKLKYIADKVKQGHESILEHSNVVIVIQASTECKSDIVEFMNHTKHLNISTKENELGGIDILIGGSIRGYKHIMRTIKNNKNVIYTTLVDTLKYLPYCYFQDMIEEGIFVKSDFINIDQKISAEINQYGNAKSYERIKPIGKVSSKYDILNVDNITTLLDKTTFDIYELMDMCTVTIHFKSVSRIISQQLTRHRAGITQLSQRYVSNENMEFISPSNFKEDLDKDKKYMIFIQTDKETQEGTGVFMTLQELGDTVSSIYPQLVRQGLKKEDARAFSPNNIRTELYMTFTLRNLFKFLELRTHKAAQAEIRLLAKDIEKDMITIWDEELLAYQHDPYILTLPYFNYIEIEQDSMSTSLVDEVISEDIIEETTEECN